MKEQTKHKGEKRIETGDKLTDNLYEAVRAYIEANNGSVVVIGGVAIVEEGLTFNYGLMVRITGKKPVFIKK